MLSAWRAGRRTDAGWILVGAALPWAALWGIYVWALVTELNPFEPFETWKGFLAGLIPVGLGLALVVSGDGPVPTRRVGLTGWQPGSRSFGTLSAAIQGSNQLGPFGVQQIAAIVALVAVQVVLGLALILNRVPDLVVIAVTAVAGGLAGTEAFIRAMPAPSRRAFEAFSWVGEHELAWLREATGEGVPLKPDAALDWLVRHPDREDLRGIRAEVQLMTGQLEEAVATAEAMPQSTPYERASRAATVELARWMAGGESDLTELEAAVQEVPRDSDDGLRAEVLLAAARTRLRMSDGRTEAGDAAQPLIDVRERLGRRADGQVGRALRKRILPIFLAMALAFGALELVLDSLGLVPFGI
jgi:hypothetical protein